MAEHPNIPRVRHARLALKMAERMFRKTVADAMEQRPVDPNGHPKYTADDVAQAADVSRARVYQIIGGEREKARGLTE